MIKAKKAYTVLNIKQLRNILDYARKDSRERYDGKIKQKASVVIYFDIGTTTEDGYLLLRQQSVL